MGTRGITAVGCRRYGRSKAGPNASVSIDGLLGNSSTRDSPRNGFPGRCWTVQPECSKPTEQAVNVALLPRV